MKKFFNTSSRLILVFSILICIWLGDNIEATVREMFASYIILIMGAYIYAMNASYSKKKKME